MKYLFIAFFHYFLMINCQFNATAQQSNWTHFRGSSLDGISRETGVPVLWNDSLNIGWKTRIDGKGWSSPVVYGNQVWLTSATENGKQMFGVCVYSKTGKKIFNIKLFEPTAIYSKHDINTFATPTPCIEKGFVYLHFGSYGTPTYAGGNIYFTSTNGETLIIKESRKLEIVARNKLKGEVFATPAIINGSILIRTGTSLYCIENE